MPNVETVRGPVDTADLGQVLAHEHVFILSHEFIVNYPDIEGFDADRAVEAAVVRMNDLVDAGVGTIVDLTVAGLGRDVALVQRVAEQTALNIVVATGYYTFTELPFFVEVRARFSGGDLADMLAGWFIGDITEGIAHTGVKAGILKSATDHPGVTPAVEEVLRAVARAHRATGVPISTHTEPATRRGLEQQKVFESEGVDLSRVVIGHSGDTADLDYLEELLARGSYLGWTASGSTGSCRSRNGCRRSSTCASAGTSTGWCSHTTPPATTTGSPRAAVRSARGTTATSPKTCSPRSARRASATPRSTPCSSTTHDASSTCRARTSSTAAHGQHVVNVPPGAWLHRQPPFCRSEAPVKGCEMERWRYKSLPISGPRRRHPEADAVANTVPVSS